MTAATSARKGLSWRLVLLGFFGLIALAMLGAVFIYFQYIKYDRVAALHLPPDTTFAARVDVEKSMLYEPFRKHLLPLFEDLLKDSKRNPEQAARLERIERHTGIELAVDIRELVVARGKTSSDWLVAIGGKFPKSGVIPGLFKVFQEEKLQASLSSDERLLQTRQGILIAQAEDGTLLAATSQSRLMAALPSQATHQRLGLSLEAAASFGLSGELLAPLASSPVSLLAPSLRTLAKLERLRGEVALGSVPTVTAVATLRPGSDTEGVLNEVRGVLDALKVVAALSPGQDIGGERALLQNAQLRTTGPEEVTLSAPWPREDIDRAAASLATAVRQSWPMLSTLL